jgi:hypothetical protein
MTSTLAAGTDVTTVLTARAAPDLAAAEAAAAALLTALGVDMSTAAMERTPARMARAFQELLTPRAFDLPVFPNDEGYRQLIIERSIALPYTAVCASRANAAAYIPTSLGCVTLSQPDTSSMFTCSLSYRKNISTGCSTDLSALNGMMPNFTDGSDIADLRYSSCPRSTAGPPTWCRSTFSPSTIVNR